MEVQLQLVQLSIVKVAKVEVLEKSLLRAIPPPQIFCLKKTPLIFRQTSLKIPPYTKIFEKSEQHIAKFKKSPLDKRTNAKYYKSPITY